MARLIEKDFPYARLSAVAEVESWRKEVYRPVYYIHKWWARRLGSVFRGIVLSACLDEGEDFWGRFCGKNDFAGTVVFDPFMGSGVTVGEAIKLGCTAVGQDINPIAYLACRVAFAKYDPTEVLATYRQLERTVGPKLLSYFDTRTDAGEDATVLYYFLVKIVPCPKCDAEIELFKTRIFSKNATPRKDPSARALCPGCGAINSTRYDTRSVTCLECARTYDPQLGNIKGATVECSECHHTFRLVDRMKSLDGPLGYHMFSHHVLKPEMMPLEANVWGTSKSSGSFSTLFRSRILSALAYKADPIELRLNSGKSSKVGGINRPIAVSVSSEFSTSENHTAYLAQGDSSCTSIPDNSVDVVVTDPPFFDNVHYSQLADFFFYWLNQVLGFSRENTTRQEAEVQDTSPVHFTNKLTSVLAECHRVLTDRGLLVFTYHHARHEGWASVHRAIRHAGFVCTQAYPIKAEMSVSMPLSQAKSPIHLDLILVCSKDDNSGTTHRGAQADIDSVLKAAQKQVVALKSADIAVSLGDTKVILMGRFLCETHRLRNLEREERFLSEIEENIDAYVTHVIQAKGEVLYTQKPSKQLVLFEEMGQYLANKGHKATK